MRTVLFLASIAALPAAVGCANAHHRAVMRFDVQRIMHLTGSEGESAGATVAAAGDVNGDGLADVFVGAPDWYPGGAVYLVFGRRKPTKLRLPPSGHRGFLIGGKDDLDIIGQSGAGVGDVNGDGLSDVLVGGGGRYTGAFIVFGKRHTAPVYLTSLGTAAIRIKGASPFGRAGDVNGDGFADVLVGFGDSFYVVFGRRDMHDVHLAHLGKAGYRIENARCCTGVKPILRHAVDIGDVNGDGRADLAVLWSPGTTHLASESMTASIVFGKSDAATIDLAAIGRNGFQIEIPFSTRDTVAPAGDVNGDGVADFVASAPFAKAGAGTVYVIFGSKHPRRENVGNLGNAGFVISGGETELGTFLGTVGDLNRDGRADLLIGSGDELGSPVWIVYGGPNTGSVRIDELRNRGFRFSLRNRFTLRNSGDPVEMATAGDVDGDGRIDLLVGDQFAGDSGAADVYAFKPPGSGR